MTTIVGWKKDYTHLIQKGTQGQASAHPTMHICVVGQHCSGDSWVATDMKGEHNMMIATVNTWLPKLSDQLKYVQKTYLVIVYDVPTACVSPASNTDEDLMALIIEHNMDILAWPEALTQAKFMAPGHGQTGCRQAPHGAKIALVLHFADPVVANNGIDWHVALFGGLFPTAKFVLHPPRCYNCQITGHLAHSSKMSTRCRLCVENHDIQQCQNMCKHTPPDQLPPLKCAGCWNTSGILVCKSERSMIFYLFYFYYFRPIQRYMGPCGHRPAPQLFDSYQRAQLR